MQFDMNALLYNCSYAGLRDQEEGTIGDIYVNKETIFKYLPFQISKCTMFKLI